MWGLESAYGRVRRLIKGHNNIPQQLANAVQRLRVAAAMQQENAKEDSAARTWHVLFIFIVWRFAKTCALFLVVEAL